jgi:DNA-binding transcriptional LysR family regulator
MKESVDRLEAMSILLLTVEKGSLSAAARELRMPLPTVSRKASELEPHLGTPLLIRTTRRLSLTEAGRAYAAAARRILEEVNEAKREAVGEFITPRGEIVLTAPMLFGRLHLLPLVAEFLDAFPEIDVRLVLSDRNLHLIDDHVDMAVRIGSLPDSSMTATRVGSIRTVVCASPRLLGVHGVSEDHRRAGRHAMREFRHAGSPVQLGLPGSKCQSRHSGGGATASDHVDG